MGFVEISVETGGMCLEKVGFLIIRNVTGGGVILGSNLFRHMANLCNKLIWREIVYRC